jgi:polyphosphate kinase 2 (PPK2 family)
MGDLAERSLWDKYMEAYEDMIRNTSRPEAPWHVVPADNKWFTRLVVAAEVVEALDRLSLKFPSITGVDRRELDKAREILRNSR